MSTTSLSSLPAPSSDTLDIVPPRPAPKRTYGRARPVSPPPITASTTSSSSSILPAAVAGAVNTSPSKALLDRWSSANQSWKDTLSKLDAPSSDNAEQQEDEEEELRKQMAKMRREARGLASLNNTQQLLPASSSSQTHPTVQAQALPIPKSKNAPGNTFSSSSLTSIPTTVPTSPLRSSPPPLPRPVSPSPPTPSIDRRLQAQSSEIAEETMFPVRKSGMMSGKQKRIIMSDDEDSDDDEEAPLFAKDTSRSASPLEGDEDLSTTERGSSPPLENRTRVTQDNIGAEDAEDEDDQDFGKLMEDLAEADRIAERRESEKTPQPRSSALDGLDDLFENDEEEHQERKGRSSKKGLNKADKAEMEKDIARAQRERPVAFSRPEPSHLPITAWLAQANVAVRTKEPVNRDVPGLTFAKSPQTSPSQQTPPDDDIIGFTPSSGLRRPLGTTSTSRISIENPNTPTPAHHRKGKDRVVVPGTSEGAESDDDEQDFNRFMEKQQRLDKEREAREARIKKLLEFKQQQIAAKQVSAKQQTAKLNLQQRHSSSDNEREESLQQQHQKEDEDSDLEFADENEITPKKNKKLEEEAMKMINGRKVPGAKAILSRTVGKATISKQKQGILAKAGILHKQKKHHQGGEDRDISETYLDFAGKTFSHANQKQLNGGSKPPNQKKGREEVLSKEELENYMKLSHQQQVKNLQKSKESVFGKGKQLPQKVEQDYSQILVQAAKDDLNNANEEDGNGEDEDDEDYNPEADDEEEDKMIWSGDEAEAEEEFADDDDVDQENTLEGNEENTNQASPTATLEDDEEDVTPIIKRKPRASARVAFNSDDEDTQLRIRSSPIQRAPLAEVHVPQPTAKSTQAEDDGFGGFDLGGFGEASGSQGFSQLFGATQAATQNGEQDAFAALRAEPAGFLHVDAMLPGIEISKTQRERDNNLIAAELEEAAMERMQEMDKPKKQYMNERGLFTQTKPASLPPMEYDEDTQVSDTRRQLGGLSDMSMVAGNTPFGKTQTQTQMGSTISPLTGRRESTDNLGSPTQTQGDEDESRESFARLRRRESASEEDGISLPLSPTQPVQQRNVFDKMMKAASRPEPRPKVKSKMVDEQAEESEDDDGWGRKGQNEDENEDDEDDADNDGFVEGLVDDQLIDDEERRKQDEMAAEKNREIQLADDARREAEARKITEGKYRNKKRGKDFLEDDELSSDDDGNKRKYSKKQKRARQLGKEDGLSKLEGEANVFRQIYEKDLESEDDEIDETPFFDNYITNEEPEQQEDGEESIHIEPKKSYREIQDMLRQRAQLNRGKTGDELVIEDMDEDGIDYASRANALKKRRDTFVDADEDEDENRNMLEEGFSISKSVRNSTIINPNNGQDQSRKRTLESYASYVQEESQHTRRVGGGAAGVSVIRPQNNGLSRSGSLNRPAPVPHPHPYRSSTNNNTLGGSASGSGSVLLSKGNKFA
ncbi:uncharacterized protein L201_003060 [Kwoniella dendrophila CBS 6074]|uniref:DNA replication checkpoint mediator MRC1 domain-containing protein n=1 Tax=Kwoniella dendrophila CBS 6074 TaxID=1295534 RepID=A0AAX4JUB9_9TREE